MVDGGRSPSPRKKELLERSYGYVLQHGLIDMSLRPLAEAIGSSPRVLLFLFGSKDGLVRELLARAREAELAMLRPSPSRDIMILRKPLHGSGSGCQMPSIEISFTSGWRPMVDR